MVELPKLNLDPSETWRRWAYMASRLVSSVVADDHFACGIYILDDSATSKEVEHKVVSALRLGSVCRSSANRLKCSIKQSHKLRLRRQWHWLSITAKEAATNSVADVKACTTISWRNPGTLREWRKNSESP